MVKKRIELPADDEMIPTGDAPDGGFLEHDLEPVEYENDEQEAVDEHSEEWKPKLYDGGTLHLDNSGHVRSEGNIEYLNNQIPATITKPGGAAVSLDTDDRQYRVSFALPYGVLVALLEPGHVDADTERAFEFHLVNFDNSLTAIGKLVLAGFDQTAVRHKMNAAWREQHNRGVGGVK